LAVTLLKGDLPNNLLSLLEVIFAGFVSGNALEHLAKLGEARRAATTEAPAPASGLSNEQLREGVRALDGRLASIEQGMMSLSAAQNATNQGVGALLDSIK
jgi:hypothetical protein